MVEFSSTVVLEAEVDSASLRQARQEIEDGVPDPIVGAGGGGGGGAAVGSGGDLATLAETSKEQLDILEDIEDDLSGGVGRGGGGGGGRGIGGLIAGIGGTAATGGSALGGLGGLLSLGGAAGGVFAGSLLLGAATPTGEGDPVTGPGSFQPADQPQGDPVVDVPGAVQNLVGGGGGGGGEFEFFGDILTQLSGVEIPEPSWLEELLNFEVPQEGDGRPPGGGQGGAFSDPTFDGPDEGPPGGGQGGAFSNPNFGGSGGRSNRPPGGGQGGAFSDPTFGRDESGSGDTTINITPDISLTQEGLSEREAERKIEAGMNDAKQQAKEELRRELVGGRTGL